MLGLFKSTTQVEVEAQQEYHRQAFEAFNEERAQARKHTPDLPQLSRRPYQRVFIYDALMKGHTQARELDASSFLANAFTQAPFELWKKRLGALSYPVALEPVFKRMPHVPIKGELWKIQTDKILELDTAHENGVQFLRVRVPIIIPYREVLFLKNRIEVHHPNKSLEPQLLSRITSNKVHSMQVTAWMYVGVSDYWRDMLDGGFQTSLVRLFNAEKVKADQYYYFSPMEFDD